MCHKAVFLGGSSRRAVVKTRSAVPKMPQSPSAFPFTEHLRRPAINLTVPKMVKARGNSPLRPKECPEMRHTRQNRAIHTTADRSTSHQLENFASIGRPARTDPKQLSSDTGCSLEDLPNAMDDRCD